MAYIDIVQEGATIIYENNQEDIAMTNTGRPTKRTKHINTRHFAIQSWVEKNLILLKIVPTGDNNVNALTKNTPKVLFNRHEDYILGRTIPDYFKIH